MNKSTSAKNDFAFHVILILCKTWSNRHNTDKKIFQSLSIKLEQSLKQLLIKSFEMDADEMNVKKLSVKCQSKKDMYRILQIEGGIYLPPIQQADHVFIAQIVTGEKRVSILFQCNNVVPTEQKHQSYSSSSLKRLRNRQDLIVCKV